MMRHLYYFLVAQEADMTGLQFYCPHQQKMLMKKAIFTGIYLEISFKILRHMTFIPQTDLILMRLYIPVKNTQSF